MHILVHRAFYDVLQGSRDLIESLYYALSWRVLLFQGLRYGFPCRYFVVLSDPS